MSTGTKLSPSSSFRCRSRSCCRASFSDESFNTERGHGISIDSGIGGTPMGNNTSISKLKRKASRLIGGSPILNNVQYVIFLTFVVGLFTLIVVIIALSKNDVRPSLTFVKPKTLELVDELGSPLGGKKAAIQYYHSFKKADDPGVLVDYDTDFVRVISNQEQYPDE